MLIQADVVFLSPPWGGPAYLHCDVFDVSAMLDGRGLELCQLALTAAPCVVYFLPRNADMMQVGRE